MFKPFAISPLFTLPSDRKKHCAGISLEHCLYPAYETPEYILETHHICLYLGQPLTYQQIIKGKLKSHSCIYGDMVIYPAGLTQKLSWDKQAEIIQLDIQPEFITQACKDWLAAEIEIIPQFRIRDPLIQQVALTLLKELQDNPDKNQLYLDSLSTTLCLHLLRHYTTSQATIKNDASGLPTFLFRRLSEYIQANLEQNLTLTDLAGVVNLSTSHLTKLFKQSQGRTLHQYLIHCRIERAKQLLKHKQLTIAEVATQVGFSDQSHFTHHFKRQTGLTPRVFRQL